jgi:hypothetical protein
VRTFLLIANVLVAFVFTVFFGYTFVGRDHIDDLARGFVTAKTQQYVTPAVDVAEEALHSPVVRRVLPKARTVAFEAEIAEFRAQPALYIQRLTAAQEPPKADSVLGAVSEKVSGWKGQIRAHYNKVLRRLFADLRIFAGSNVVAAMVDFCCAWRSLGRPSWQLTAISAVLLAAIAVAVYSYVNDFGFFTILFDRYSGWAYPATIGALFISIYFEYRSHLPRGERQAGEGSG